MVLVSQAEASQAIPTRNLDNSATRIGAAPRTAATTGYVTLPAIRFTRDGAYAFVLADG